MSKSYDDEISSICTEWDSSGRDMKAAFIAHDLVGRHKKGLSTAKKHADFHKHFTYKAVRQDVGRFIAKNYGTDADDESSKQPCFPGFDHVQRRYVVKRDGDEVGILADQLTDEEIDWLANRLSERSKTCAAHADELRRFKTWRKETLAA